MRRVVPGKIQLRFHRRGRHHITAVLRFRSSYVGFRRFHVIAEPQGRPHSQNSNRRLQNLVNDRVSKCSLKFELILHRRVASLMQSREKKGREAGILTTSLVGSEHTERPRRRIETGAPTFDINSAARFSWCSALACHRSFCIMTTATSVRIAVHRPRRAGRRIRAAQLVASTQGLALFLGYVFLGNQLAPAFHLQVPSLIHSIFSYFPYV